MSDHLVTESDVEQKLIYPLLISPHGLGFAHDEVKTKQYLRPSDLDKGAGKTVGYYPDYSVILSGLPVLVLEAKAPHENCQTGFREAQLYAHAINKAFPSGANPVRVVVSSNGKEIVYGKWDTDDIRIIPFEAVVPGIEMFEEFRDFCKREALILFAKHCQAQLFPSFRYKAIKFLGGPTKQSIELPPNRFSKDLVPLLKRYFDSDASRSRREVIEKAYCPTQQTTHYNTIFESLLKDNLSKHKFPAFQEVNTSRSNAPDVNDALKTVLRSNDRETDTMLLLIGGVGAGKSMFIDRFYSHLLDDQTRENTLWFLVDFNNAPADLANLEEWMAKEIIADFATRNNLPHLLYYEELIHYFAPKIAERKRGPYRDLEQSQPDEFKRRIADDLARWSDDPKLLVQGLIRYYAGDKGIRVVGVFDNADKRDRNQQLQIFQEVQHFRAAHRCFGLLALRDETYDRYKSEPPLDAFLTPFAFRIAPPRFLDVAKKRLELIIADLSTSAPKKLSYSLENGMVIEYPATELGTFLIGVYRSLFNPSRRIRLILEALAGNDVREALKMFVDILISGHLADEQIFVARYANEGIRLSESLIIRILMRTKFQYFQESHGYVVNLFDIDETSNTTSNFLLTEILTLLATARKKQGELGIEGYRHVDALVETLTPLGYLAEDILWGLAKALRTRLIIADHQRTDSVSREDYVKITASGFYHLRILMKRFEYFCGVSLDSWLRNKELVNRISAHSDLTHDPYGRKGYRKRQKVLALEKALEEELEIHSQQASLKPEFLTASRYAITSIREAVEWRPGFGRDDDDDDNLEQITLSVRR